MALAEQIARDAHGSIGQTRADGVTPYIHHPARVVALLDEWRSTDVINVNLDSLDSFREWLAAAWLHDVVEDTPVTLADLRDAGVSSRTCALVALLTKPPEGGDLTAYHAAISRDVAALTLKCGDRCANLEDAARDVRERRGSRRWAKYAAKTRRDLLPLYSDHPRLLAELQRRLDALDWCLAERRSITPTV